MGFSPSPRPKRKRIRPPLHRPRHNHRLALHRKTRNPSLLSASPRSKSPLPRNPPLVATLNPCARLSLIRLLVMSIRRNLLQSILLSQILLLRGPDELSIIPFPLFVRTHRLHRSGARATKFPLAPTENYQGRTRTRARYVRRHLRRCEKALL